MKKITLVIFAIVTFAIMGGLIAWQIKSNQAMEIHKMYCVNENLHYIRTDNASCILDYSR